MTKVVIHPVTQNGTTGLAILTPVGLSVEEVAKKDVPVGVPYLIVDSDDFPNPEFFGAWEADFSKPDGYGMGHDAWFAEQLKAAAQTEQQSVEVVIEQPTQSTDGATQ